MYLKTRVSHIGCMSTHPNKIAEIRRKKKITQQDLADRLGVHVITVSKLERGVMQLTSSWLERLAEALGVSELEVWGGFTGRHIEANARIYENGRIAVVDPERNEFMSYLNPLGDFSSKWLHVRDNSLLPFFGEADLVQFTVPLVEGLEGDDLFNGRICMYALDEQDTLNLGVMEKKNEDGTYNLRSLNGRQMKGININVIWYLSGYMPNWGIASVNQNDSEKDEDLAK